MEFKEFEKIIPTELKKFINEKNFIYHQIHYKTLLQWQSIVQLVSNESLGVYWQRHVIDGIQLLLYLQKHNIIIDIGTGGGFPAISCAIESAYVPEKQFYLIESQQKKCAFLNEIVRKTKINAHVLCTRIEDYKYVPRGTSADTDIAITSRALADLGTLLKYSYSILNGYKNYKCYFLKSNNVKEELTRALECWKFNYTLHSSFTDTLGYVVEINSIQPR